MKHDAAAALLGAAAMLTLLVTPQPARGYEAVKVSNGGTVRGAVKLDGPQPAPEEILINKNNEVCGSGSRKIQWVEVGSAGGLVRTVVYLHEVEQGKGWKAADHVRTDPVLDQEECVFKPWLQVVPKGTEMVVKNSDPVLHNVHVRELIGLRPGRSRAVKRTMLNEAQPGAPGDPAADITARVDPRRSNFIAINCEAHNFMFAWMFAAGNPYVVKTAKDGSYELTDVPPGTYTLRAWHPTLGLQETEVTVKAGGSAEHSFTFVSPAKS